MLSSLEVSSLISLITILVSAGISIGMSKKNMQTQDRRIGKLEAKYDSQKESIHSIDNRLTRIEQSSATTTAEMQRLGQCAVNLVQLLTEVKTKVEMMSDRSDS